MIGTGCGIVVESLRGCVTVRACVRCAGSGREARVRMWWALGHAGGSLCHLGKTEHTTSHMAGTETSYQA